jgi:hypothetical protein
LVGGLFSSFVQPAQQVINNSLTGPLISHDMVDSSFDLYLLIGQSNMAGRGIITPEYAQEGNANLLMLDKSGAWVQAKHPLHFDKPAIAGVGPGLAFGLDMLSGTKSKKIGLVPCAVGGTSIDKWIPGAFDTATNTHPYDDMLVRLKEASKSGVFKGILWLQGEADADTAKAAVYLKKLAALILDLREKTKNQRLPFVAGEIGQFREKHRLINEELKKLPAAVPFTAIASSDGLKDKGDNLHFDAPSAEIFGKRFAVEMKKLQK